MQENNISILKNYVLHSLNNTTCDSSSVLKITDMFNTLQNPFDKLKTEYMQMKTLKDIGVFIGPISVTVGSRYNNIVRNGSIIMENKDDNIYYIPLHNFFKCFFEQLNVFNIITTHLKELYSSDGSIISSSTIVQCN